MNTRNEASEGIVSFLESDKKVLLITGTHQYEKHKLVLQTISEYCSHKSRILFRGNSMQNFGTFFENNTASFKTGEGYKIANHTMYLDTINRTSWKKTRYDYDFGILYPLDSAYKDAKRDELLQDLINRCNKVLLVSWTDNTSFDYSKINHFLDSHVIFDALEERPNYHQRILDSL